MKILNFKLFNTDGKTFFDFRSNPESRMEGFTITFCDDGTVVMTGDYGVLAWKRCYRKDDGNYDYGFPDKDTNIGYFASKVCQFGIQQKIMEFNMEKAKKEVREELKGMDNSYGENKTKQDVLEGLEWLEDYDEIKLQELLRDYYSDYELWENLGMRYTSQFEFMFECLKSISEQILEIIKIK